MQRDTTKRFYAVHSWVGAITAVLIFIIAFTGAVSVFGRPEIKTWAHEVSHVPAELDPLRIEQVLREDAATVPEAYLDNIQVLMPGVRRRPVLSVQFDREVETADGRTEHHIIRFDHDPKTYELVDRLEGEPREVFENEPKDLADFIITFHADLHLGDPIGLLLTGLLGLTLFASIVTGVITHRKVLKEAFTFRPFRSLRLLFTDSHKVLGVWGLVFNSAIAFTGAFLGLAVVLLLPAAAYVSFEGDLDKMVETYLPLNEPQKSGIPAELKIAEVLSAVDQPENGPIVSAQLLTGTDQAGVAHVYTLAGDGIGGETHRYQLNGTVLESVTSQFSQLGGAAGPILDAMFPIHFGNFGGTVVKLIWFVLGLGTALLAVSGSMIWVERRVHGSSGSLSVASYRRISRFTVGACCGVVLATVTLFHLQLFVLPQVATTQTWLMGTFFGSWALAIVWSMLRTNDYQTTRELLGLTGAAAALVPIANGFVTGNHLLNVFSGGHWVVAGVDLGLLLLGAALVVIALKLPSQRPLRKSENRQSASPSSGLSGDLAYPEASTS